MREAQQYVQAGLRWVVGVDLKSFFDRVNHDVLMGMLSKRTADKTVLGLIRRYLEAGVMANGVTVERHEGTPQGGPLAPSLRRQFLGFSLWVAPGRQVKRKVSRKALEVMKRRVRWLLTRRTRGQSLAQVVERLRAYLVGWKAYFRLADTPGVFSRLDEWIRHRLRAIQLKHWRRGRTTYREPCARGMPHGTARQIAANSRRWWRNSRFLLNAALPIRFFDELGLPRLAA